MLIQTKLLFCFARLSLGHLLCGISPNLPLLLTLLQEKLAEKVLKALRVVCTLQKGQTVNCALFLRLISFTVLRKKHYFIYLPDLDRNSEAWRVIIHFLMPALHTPTDKCSASTDLRRCGAAVRLAYCDGIDTAITFAFSPCNPSKKMRPILGGIIQNPPKWELIRYDILPNLYYTCEGFSSEPTESRLPKGTCTELGQSHCPLPRFRQNILKNAKFKKGYFLSLSHGYSWNQVKVS